MPGISTPLFPDDVPTHPLLVIDYRRVKDGDKDEIEKLWNAATQLGFWYLKNHGVDAEVDGMFDMGLETMALPMDEKMAHEQGDDGASFGYKAAGTNAVDEKGNLDSTEFINVSKDDALAFPNVVHRPYPSTVVARMNSTIRPFVEKSVEVNNTLINTLNAKLGLPEGTLAQLHNPEEQSRCVARVIRAPPKPGPIDEQKAMLSAHTDFGSLSFLHNRLGGLQVLAPGTDKWQYIKPVPGHAICNIGDSLTIFSGGILRSNMHRVVPPPKEQGKFERYSVVFFTRANDNVELRALVEDSPLIAGAVANTPNAQVRFWPGVTARGWLERRVRGQRIKYYKGPESFKNWMGTEDVASMTKASAILSESTTVREVVAM